MVNDAAREAGVKDRHAFGDYVEESKHGRRPSNNYTYEEFLELSREYISHFETP